MLQGSSGDELRLQLAADITCYQPWQYLLFVLLFVVLVPMPLALLLMVIHNHFVDLHTHAVQCCSVGAGSRTSAASIVGLGAASSAFSRSDSNRSSGALAIAAVTTQLNGNVSCQVLGHFGPDAAAAAGLGRHLRAGQLHAAVSDRLCVDWLPRAQRALLALPQPDHPTPRGGIVMLASTCTRVLNLRACLRAVLLLVHLAGARIHQRAQGRLLCQGHQPVEPRRRGRH